MKKIILLLSLITILVFFLTGCTPTPKRSTSKVVITTWNLRGYPEKEQTSKQWLHLQLLQMNSDVLCVQEIANQQHVNEFLSCEPRFTKAAFVDSSDGQDNAIFCTALIDIKDLPDPAGFQHPAQAAYVSCGGFDAVIVTVHLSWTNVQMRQREKLLLRDVALEMLKIDPDVIICGDFNTEGQDIQTLADSIGMKVMIPQSQNGIGTTHAGHRYDHFLISPDLANEEAVSCHINTYTGDDLKTAKKVSDHLSVSAIFRTDLQFRDRK